MDRFKTFTGGPYATNSFLVKGPGGNILFDAPEGADAAFAGEQVDLLVLTHGHWDHVTDAAAIKHRHNCPVLCHGETVPMVSQADFFVRQGFPLRVVPFTPDGIIAEGRSQSLLGWTVDVFDVPGHCPGSLCFFSPEDKLLLGGDVLFRGGIGRWDLPGGDGELLLQGIHSKLMSLPPDTTVLSGHGPATTIGEEKSSNPFLRA